MQPNELRTRKIQQTLNDLGYDTGPNGGNGESKKKVVERFQRDASLTMDGIAGPRTKEALTRFAPPPGEKLERSVEYDRLYEDGRLDVTIALGFDEHGGHTVAAEEVVVGLRSRGYREQEAPSREERGPRRFERSSVDSKTGARIDSLVRVISPDPDGPSAREHFKDALERDEVVIYGGHARYGTGPDFDAIDRGSGNFVFDGRDHKPSDHPPPPALRSAIAGRGTDLDELRGSPSYQVLIFNGCSTEDYLDSLRSDTSVARNLDNTDIIATTTPILVRTTGRHVLRFLDGLSTRETNNRMLADQNWVESDSQRLLGSPRERDAATVSEPTYMESGFLTNESNQTVPK